MQFLVDPSAVRVGPAAWFFLVVVCTILPLAVVRQHRSLLAGALPAPTRDRIYASAIATHLILVLMVWAVVRGERLDLFPPYHVEAFDLVIGLIALAIGLLPILERFRMTDVIARERTRLIAPRNGREYALFYLVSLTAGIAEELTFRGLLFTLLSVIVGGWWLAAVLAAAVFGIVHVFQGWKSAGVAALIGLRDQIVVGLTGTLFIAIAVHTLHDAIAGTVIGIRAGREEAALVTHDG